jgi:hypothetical protein
MRRKLYTRWLRAGRESGRPIRNREHHRPPVTGRGRHRPRHLGGRRATRSWHVLGAQFRLPLSVRMSDTHLKLAVCLHLAVISVSAGVVDAVAADQTDTSAVFVRQHPLSVDPFLVDPAVAVEQRADERGGHRQVQGKHEHSFYLALLTYLRSPARRRSCGRTQEPGDVQDVPCPIQGTSSPSRLRSHGRYGSDAPNRRPHTRPAAARRVIGSSPVMAR